MVTSSYLTINEIAELLRTSTRTVYRLAEEKAVPFVKLRGKNSKLLFPREKILSWLQEREAR